MSTVPIGAHALLSDCLSALRSPGPGRWTGSASARFDSPSVFARLLDDDGGHWSLAPVGCCESKSAASTPSPLPQIIRGWSTDCRSRSSIGARWPRR